MGVQADSNVCHIVCLQDNLKHKVVSANQKGLSLSDSFPVITRTVKTGTVKTGNGTLQRYSAKLNR